MMVKDKHAHHPESITQKVEDLMPEATKVQNHCKSRISRVETTDERITGRGGLSLFVRYLEGTGVLAMLDSCFGSVRKSRKGLPVSEMFKQILCFFMDGTSRHLRHFDQLTNDPGYAATIQTRPKAMASSHAIKRFMKAFSMPLVWFFRWVLLELFVWRLRLKKPEIIILGIDLVVLNNDDAVKREEVKPTYKKVKGFGALNLTWENLVVDSVLRSGNKHSNHGRSVHRMIKRVVTKIRNRYADSVPILFRMDSGFLDQSVMDLIEDLDLGHTVSGKLYKDTTAVMEQIPEHDWQRYYGRGPAEENQIWEFFEFGDRRGTWNRFRRAIFTRPMMSELGQHYLPTLRPCQVIETNLGMGQAIDRKLAMAGYGYLTSPEGIIDLHHGRGEDELVFRSVKDFGSEALPFQSFRANAVYYYCMLLAHFLFCCFKTDVCSGVMDENAYPTTVRRKLIDIGAKIVSHAGSQVLKVARAVWDRLQFDLLWQRSGRPPQIQLV
jgi:hypothetical protein